MRSLIFSFLLIFSLGCSDTKHATPGSSTNVNLGKLNGNWIPVKQEIHGTTLPASTFKTQKLTIDDSTYSFVAESVDKGTVKYADYRMDIYGKEGVNAGKHFTAIYKFENGELTICYNLGGDSYPEAFETNSKPLLFLSVFKKESTQ